MIYAINSFAVGKATRLFQNQKVQLELLSGDTAVGKELFAAADQVDGYKPELVITDSRGRDGVIKTVFANGAVAYQLRNPSNGEEKAWVVEVARMVAKRDNLPSWCLPWGTNEIFVTMPENMPEI